MSKNLINKPCDLYRIRVELKDIYPKIWRRLDVPTELTLLELNDVIQAAFSWCHSHLWEFKIRGVTFVNLSLIDWEDSSLIDAEEIDLKTLVNRRVRKFKYRYDFGDNWVHLVSIFKRSPKQQPNVSYPALIGGERASPPEDVGGIWGYEGLLEAIQDPEHPRHDTLAEWMDIDSFDPNWMEAEAIRLRLAKIAKYLA